MRVARKDALPCRDIDRACLPIARVGGGRWSVQRWVHCSCAQVRGGDAVSGWRCGGTRSHVYVHTAHSSAVTANATAREASETGPGFAGPAVTATAGNCQRAALLVSGDHERDGGVLPRRCGLHPNSLENPLQTQARNRAPCARRWPSDSATEEPATTPSLRAALRSRGPPSVATSARGAWEACTGRARWVPHGHAGAPADAARARAERCAFPTPALVV